MRPCWLRTRCSRRFRFRAGVRFVLDEFAACLRSGNLYGMYFFGYGNFVPSVSVLGFRVTKHFSANWGYQLASGGLSTTIAPATGFACVSRKKEQLSARTLPSETVRKNARTASFPRCPVTFDSSCERCKIIFSRYPNVNERPGLRCMNRGGQRMPRHLFDLSRVPPHAE
jgi:hypothetical protein